MLAGHSSMSQRRNRYEQASTVDWDGITVFSGCCSLLNGVAATDCGRKLLASVRGPFVPWLECMKMFAVFTFVRYTSHSVLGKCHLTSCAFIGKFKSRRPQSSGSIAIWDWVVRRRSRFLSPNPISWYQPRMSRTRREKKTLLNMPRHPGIYGTAFEILGVIADLDLLLIIYCWVHFGGQEHDWNNTWAVLIILEVQGLTFGCA